jgi:hypothetical protein
MWVKGFPFFAVPLIILATFPINQPHARCLARWLYIADYHAFPGSVIAFSGKIGFAFIPNGYEPCYIINEQLSLLVNRYPDGLTPNEIARKIVLAGFAVYEWARHLSAYKDFQQCNL